MISPQQPQQHAFLMPLPQQLHRPAADTTVCRAGGAPADGTPAPTLNYPREFVLRRLLVFVGIVIGCASTQLCFACLSVACVFKLHE